MRFLLILTMLFMVSTGPLTAGDLIAIEHEGLDRKALLENVGGEPRPLIVYLHSYHSEDRQQKLVDSNYQNLAWTKLNELAQERGLLSRTLRL